MDKFNISTYKYLLEESEGNRQTYGRANAAKEYKLIKEKIIELDSSFDFTTYANFNRAEARA